MRKLLLGCLIVLAVRDDMVNRVSNTGTAKVKTGTKGMTANKGSVAIRFDIDDTSFMFLNCHLTSG